jgi:hypothetical protein
MTSKNIMVTVFLIFALIMMTLGNVLAESPGRIAGRIVDANNSKPLGNVKVELVGGGPSNVVATNRDGYYVLLAIPPGKYKVVFSCVGYKTMQYPFVEVLSDLTTTIDAEMMPPWAKISTEKLPGTDDTYVQPRGRLAGRVIDAETRKPVVSANVMLKSSSYENGTCTDLDGKYLMIGVHPGIYKVTFFLFNYKTIEVSKVEIASDTTTCLNEEMNSLETDSESKVPDREIPELEPPQIESTQLKQTIITPVMETPIVPGKNLIYCSTFQIAWNMLQDSIIREPIRLTGDPEVAKLLNKQLSTTKDISEDCYVAMVDSLTPAFLDRINEALRQKFGDQAPQEVEVPINPAFPQFLSYAYLYKNLRFATEFERLEAPLTFTSSTENTPVKVFGINKYEPYRQPDAGTQVSVLYYEAPWLHRGSKGDCIISLKSQQANDEIILAEITPEGTLLETLAKVNELAKQSSPDRMAKDDRLQIPVLDFNVKHGFDELVTRYFLNQDWQDWFISGAMQWIRFRLNEKGVVLKSEARTVIAMGMESMPRYFIFDRPFLIYLKQKDGKYPYFAMWVDNAELMVKQ